VKSQLLMTSALAALLALGACGPSETDESETTQSEETEQETESTESSEEETETETEEEESSDGDESDEQAMSAPEMDIERIDATLSAAQFSALCEAEVAGAKDDFATLEAFDGPLSVDGVMAAYDDLQIRLDNIAGRAGLFANVHPDAEVRAAGDACIRELSKLGTDISLSRPLYDKLSQVDASGENEATQYSLMKTLRSFRRSGVDQDEATRQRIRELNEEITRLGQDFGRTIREDTRYLILDSVEQLDGLPQDYIDAHQPGEDGKIRISTDYPDYFPFMTYATDDDLRRQMRVLARSRGYPENAETLKDLITQRDALAKILGYGTYADYTTEVMMVATRENASSFIDGVREAVEEPMQRDLAILLERLREIDPDAERVQVWQHDFLSEKVRQEDYEVDSREVRQYFAYDKVKAGIFQLTEDLFEVEIREWDTPVWHQDVKAYELYSNDGELIGRFYLDMHPRADKYKHAAHFGAQNGIAGRQVPISTLVCNFPSGSDLMEHDQVETFLHEFGHLLHALFASKNRWYNNSGISTEWDFVEAPSQMLEEWVWDYETISTFATNAEGEVIPEALLSKMNRARNFGRGIRTGIQTFYARLSLDYYSLPPESFELLSLMKDLQAEYSPYPYVEGTHFYANFGHLNGYSANYYTYQWSLSIAADLFSKFETAGLRDAATATAYKEKILVPGGSKPAAELVEDFLGRPYTLDAYEEMLKK